MNKYEKIFKYPLIFMINITYKLILLKRLKIFNYAHEIYLKVHAKKLILKAHVYPKALCNKNGL